LKNKIFSLFLLGLWGLGAIDGQREAAAVDSYEETFDSRQDGVTIDGVDSWKVSQGDTTNAATQSGVTFSGSGKSLKLTGALTTTTVGRSKSYGALTPTWIRFSVRPLSSGQTPNVPTTGIGAVNFSPNGRVLAASGSAWVDTGMSYTTGEWYDVALKLDFKTHHYDLYVSLKKTPKIPFTPIKSGLKFIDASINSLSKLTFYGAYSTTQSGDVYVDDLSVTSIDRLEIISLPQKIILDQPSNPIIIQLQNANSEPQTALSNITVELKTTSSKGRFSLTREPWQDIAQALIPKDSQSVAVYYKDSVVGKPTITASESPDQGLTDALQQQEITAQVSYFDIELDPLQLAGQDFLLKITATKEDGTVDESYGGSVLIEPDYVFPATGRFEISPAEGTGFVMGKLQLKNANYPDAGVLTITITDKDDPSKTGTSSQILFLPAAFIVGAGQNQTVAKPFGLAVTALNAQGQATPNYNGKVSLTPIAVNPTSIALGVLAPSEISGPEFQNGAANPQTTWNLYGTIKIQVQDSKDSTRQGLSPEITFYPKSLSVKVEPPAGRDFFYIGEPISLLVQVLDELGRPIPNYPGTIELSAGGGLTLPGEYTYTSQDAGEHKFLASAVQAGEYLVSALAKDGALKAESPPIVVKNAFIQVLDTTSPVGTAEVIIQIVDELGNVIRSESNLSVSVRAVEEIDDQSASLPSVPVRFQEGRAIIPVVDSQAEIVTIIPSSPYKIQVKKGTITFGRAGKTGVSTLMWRELKGK